MKMNEFYPGRYPASTAVAGKTREEVRAETLDAIRTGEIRAAGDSGLKMNEVYPQRYAKAQAREAVRHRTMAAGSGQEWLSPHNHAMPRVAAAANRPVVAEIFDAFTSCC